MARFSSQMASRSEDYIFLTLFFRERGREREGENVDVKEKHPLVASHTCSEQGPIPQPRDVP